MPRVTGLDSFVRLRPPELPGVGIVRGEREQRLWRGIKPVHAIHLTLQGVSERWYRGQVLTEAPGTLSFKEAGEVYRDVRRHTPGTFQVIAFDSALVDEARDALGVSASGYLRVLQLKSEDPRAHALLRLHEALRSSGTPVDTQRALLTEALGAYVSLMGRGDEPARRGWRVPVRRAQSFLVEHLTEPVSLDMLASEARLDKYHLCRAFRDEVGLPPHEYLTHLRIRKAQSLLEQGHRPAEVAADVGLYDQSQLHRHFRRIVGVTPGQYARALSR
ncbi:helix-turn-helix transcriptional regulator [Myxococcaceae bacterium JPH2]|nr:helix-turn-helix transcriptional regulator [Myxococcaceae bacterium JPH2]